jgi:hypothetical protein
VIHIMYRNVAFARIKEAAAKLPKERADEPDCCKSLRLTAEGGFFPHEELAVLEVVADKIDELLAEPEKKADADKADKKSGKKKADVSAETDDVTDV